MKMHEYGLWTYVWEANTRSSDDPTKRSEYFYKGHLTNDAIVLIHPNVNLVYHYTHGRRSLNRLDPY